MCRIQRSEMADLAEVHASALTNLLPDDTPYKVTECKLLDSSVSPREQHFIGELRLAIRDAGAAKEWLGRFQEASQVTLRLRATSQVSKSGQGQNAYKAYYRCQHNTLRRSATADLRKGSKNTSCPALVTLTVKRPLSKHSKLKGKDPLLDDFPTVVRIEHTHNHILNSADSLKHRDVSADVVEKLKLLYSKGHTPTAALELHKMDLFLEHGTDSPSKLADRACCPDIQFCHRLYKKVFKEAYGTTAASLEESVESLKSACNTFNTENKGVFCKVNQTATGKVAIAICTPLMLRVHSLHWSSGEVVYLVGCSGVPDCRVFMLLTHSSVGGLPLGCLIVSSEASEDIREALELYKELLPSDAFFGRGLSGPQVFLTDDCQAEKESLHKAFPTSAQILCAFRVLQAAWRFLWDSASKVPKHHRPHMLQIMKSMVCAQNQQQLIECYIKGTHDDTVMQHEEFCQYLDQQFQRQEVWAVCRREDLSTRYTTSSICKTAMHVLKDKIFCRTRAYNMLQLLDFMLTRLPAFYKCRLLDMAHGKTDSTISRHYFVDQNGIKKEMVKPLGDLLFDVASKSEADKTYTVDMNTDMCSCTVGLAGTPCKHQLAVTKHFSVSSSSAFTVTDEPTRTRLYTLATGCGDSGSDWSQPLVENHESVPDVEQRLQNRVKIEEQDEEQQEEYEEMEHGEVDMQEVEVEDLDDDFRVNEANDNSSNNFNLFRRNWMELYRKVEAAKDELSPAIDAFNNQMQKVATVPGIASALFAFGKAADAAHVAQAGLVPARPTAVSPCRAYAEGQVCCQSGREPSVPAEFHKRKRKNQEDSYQRMLKKKPEKAPNDLN